MVTEQIVTVETVTFTHNLDAKKIHGFNTDRGLELLKPDVAAKHPNDKIQNSV